MDCCKTWFAYLCAEIIEQCIERCQRDCPACRDGFKSPILHYHLQRNLHEKLDIYFHRVIPEMDIADLFNKFIIHFGWMELSKEEFIAIGQSFVRFSTPDAIFYGKYLTKENDYIIYGGDSCQTSVNPGVALNTTECDSKPIKTKKRKKNTISQNDVLGGGDAN